MKQENDKIKQSLISPFVKWLRHESPTEYHKTQKQCQKVIYSLILSENYFKLDQFSLNLQYSFKYTLFFTLVKNKNRTEHCQGYQFPGRKINNVSRKVHSFLLTFFFTIILSLRANVYFFGAYDLTKKYHGNEWKEILQNVNKSYL